MSLRARLTVFVAVAVGAAVAVVALFAYSFARNEALDEVDSFLRDRGPVVGLVGAFDLADLGGRRGRNTPEVPAPFGTVVREDAVAQLVQADGTVLTLGVAEVVLPVDGRDLAIARSGGPDYLRDVVVDDTHYRMLTRPVSIGVAIQVGRDMTETDSILGRVRARMLALGLAGAGIAAALGWVVSRRSLHPVEVLTEAAEHVAETQQLEARIEVDQGDELGRLATAFNRMLGALEEARASQQRLIADASHELRTPLTSLRTNIELLKKGAVNETDRADVLADVHSELEELTHMVAELVDLATIGRDEEPRMDLDLAELVEQAVARARRRTSVAFTATLEPTPMEGKPHGLLRAVSNLLDNAVKWGEEGERVEVTLSERTLTVRDHGPGIPEEDIDRVFQRFFRSPRARSQPGSGLGLSIVAAVAEDHGGSCFARNAPGGGAEVGFTLHPADE